MFARIILLSFCLICTTLSTVQAQIEKRTRKPTKKEMTVQIDQLNLLVDSLRAVLSEYEMAAADSLLQHEILESAFLDELEGDFFEYDSLSTEQRLSLYYHQNALQQMADPVNMEELDSVVLSSSIPDSVYMQRLSQMNSFIKLPYNSIVKNYIITYTQNMPTRIPTILGLAQYYMPIFEEVFDSYELPLELKAMAVIESALNPRAVSRVQAKGMWQFMYRTALQYKLTINSYVDERLDPIRSTYAAAEYLRDAYHIFGDWALAIASYNCGAGNVNKAIRRAGGSREFWAIYPFLPRETRGYVPAFVAALYTMRYYSEHQIKPSYVEMPAHVDTFEVNKMLHFEQIAAYLDISIDELRDLNPQYTKDIVPGVERTYTLRLPFEFSGDFAAHEKEIYAYKDSVYFNPLILNTMAKASDTQVTHVVRSGQTLSSIALRYGVRVADIKYWNGLRSDRISINQRLIIYTRGSGTRATSSSANLATTSKATSNVPSSAPDPSGTLVNHIVSKNETLGGIAERYGVTSTKIRAWNSLKNSTIYPNQKLKVYARKNIPAAAAQASTSTSPDAKYEYYTVKKGDTLWDISNTLNIPLATLRSLNGFGSTPKLMPGQKIKVRKL